MIKQEYDMTRIEGSISDLEYNTYCLKFASDQNKGSRTRDSEKAKVYLAEHHAENQFTSNYRMHSIEDVQALVDRIQKSEVFAGHRPKIGSQYFNRPIKVIPTRSNRWAGEAFYYERELKISTTELCGAMMLYTVIHEMAHMAGNLHHGRTFRNCLLDLVKEFMSDEDHDILLAEFKKSKLQVGAAKKPKTYKQWKANRVRMEKVRAAKGVK